jgi:elongation factor G
MPAPDPSARLRRRSIALVGPYGSGKSTLFDALVGGNAAAAARRAQGPRTRNVGTTLRLGQATYRGDEWCILDCPGSVEFAYEAACALTAVDLAVVVCDPAPDRAAAVAPLLSDLAARQIPYIVFINKIDTLTGRVRDALGALQAYSRFPLVLRQVPIREGEAVSGYVDLISERAYRYRPGQPSELMQACPTELKERQDEARAGLLETLADHDDALLEKILEDVTPTPEEIYRQLHADQAAGQIAEVLLGSAERSHGVQRLWKALRHDVPDNAATAAARGIPLEGGPLAQVFRTQHAGHLGKLSFVRIWRGVLNDGTTFGPSRIGGIFQAAGDEMTKVPEAEAGQIVALARMEGVATGDTLGGDRLPFPDPPQSVYSLAIATEDRKDDVKLSGALQKLLEEDPSLTLEHRRDTAEMVLFGQGELHLRSAVERLGKAYNLKLSTRRPQVPFKETIRRPVSQHARLKRQTGGHGQFADVTLEIAPRGRGEGFTFSDRITGGVVPKQYIPAVAEAAEAATQRGPLGHPVVDVAVTLVNGTFHSVDSSDMAFQTATRMAMADGLAKADPVLLEPVDHVTVLIPRDSTAGAQRLLTGRRGRILGYAESEARSGWDEVEALVPEAELHDFIIELRSQTTGLGTFRRRFDHLAETAVTHSSGQATARAG